MIGLDINVVVRDIVQNDPAQSRLTPQAIEARSAHDPGFVSIVTLADIPWILKAAYVASHGEIGDVVEIYADQTLAVQLAEIAWKAWRPIAMVRPIMRVA